MKEKLKLLFDENFGQPLVHALANLLAFYESPLQVEHLIHYVGRHGERDDVWIPLLAKEGWIVITADLGRCGGLKLPRICAAEKVTHVLLSGSLHQRKQFEKARAILVVWPELIDAATEPKGTRFKLQLGPTHPVLVKVRSH